ncbi:putative Ig domain-containing protein [Subtercola sp. RTI3]|uniref:putative Ig domain-containing protein n=1 Tax=Subtercola sp. RTI3 TaxID=3048639 RepID=UPI002B22B793|nr:putative Ig domain-containing protein [Subtercola sp. RTI3]MEA9985754.1 putative Ig domain-containing protein [Subtercola sp. RTI3]
MTRQISVSFAPARGAARALHTAAKKSLLARAALVVPTTVALSLVVGAVLAPAASAAPVATAAAASATTVTAAGPTATLGSDVPTLGAPGNGVKLEVRVAPSTTDADKQTYFSTNVAVYSDGRVKFISNGKCLDTWAANGFQPLREVGIFQDCIENPSQAYYFVPASTRPSAAANIGADDRWFYIVSQSGNKCFSSKNHGLSPIDDFGARLAPCEAGNTSQQFRIINDAPDALGINRQWENILGLALQYATNHCASYTGPDETSPCAVSTGTSIDTATWSAAGSQAARALGVLTTRSAGCGTIDQTSLPTMHNATSNPIPVALTTSGSYSHQTTVGDTETTGASFSYQQGLKDVWSASGSLSFSWAHQEVTVNTSTQNNSTTVNPTVQPGDWLMGTWESQVLQFTGFWKLGVDAPSTSPGSLTWYIPATSILPAALTSTKSNPLTFTPVTSHSQKDCDAGPPSINTAPPTLGSTPDCSAPAVARVRTTVYACPGTWATPGINPELRYAYQWYTIPQGSNTPSMIPGATASSYTVSEQVLPASPAVGYLGAIVTELGPINRRESAPATTLATVQLQPAAVGASSAATNFVGRVPDATAGEAYSTALVTDAGSAMKLSSDAADLKGLSITADGAVSGTPPEAGDYPFSITDTPGDGGPVQVVNYVLHVAALPTAFASSTDISATVGQAVASDLVSSDTAGQPVNVVGTLPPGLSFDGETGELTGIPVAAGVTQFTVESSWASAVFTVTVADVATVLSPDALPGGTVGAAYSAETVSSLGSNVQIGLLGTGPANETDPAAPAGQLAAPDLSASGLSLNSETGRISGTPTAAGTITLSVANLSEPSTAPQTKTIVIAAAGGGSNPAPNGDGKTSLAATGSRTVELGPIALLLAAFGAVAMIARRRRRRLD